MTQQPGPKGPAGSAGPIPWQHTPSIHEMILRQMGGEPDGLCRHCEADIWKQLTYNEEHSHYAKQVAWVSWVSAVRSQRGDGPEVTRFCPRVVAERLGSQRVQHSPVRFDDRASLEKWLEQSG